MRIHLHLLTLIQTLTYLLIRLHLLMLIQPPGPGRGEEGPRPGEEGAAGRPGGTGG